MSLYGFVPMFVLLLRRLLCRTPPNADAANTQRKNKQNNLRVFTACPPLCRMAVIVFAPSASQAFAPELECAQNLPESCAQIFHQISLLQDPSCGKRSCRTDCRYPSCKSFPTCRAAMFYR